MRTIESSGKTVEEALRSGLQELGCDISEVTYEVIDKGSTGLFGMFGRLARVRITVKEKDDDFDFEMPVLSLNPQNAESEKKAARKEKAVEPKQKKEKPVKEAKAEKPATEAKAPAAEEKVEEAAASAEEKAEPKAEKPARKRTRQPKKEKPAETSDTEAPSEEKPEPAPAKPELPPLDVDSLSETGKRAYDFLSNVTRLMGVEVEIRMLEEENHLTVEMTGDTLGVLIGRRGETMDAIQYLTSLTVNKEKSEYTRVSIDVEHYRAKREETLRKLALRMANRAKKSGRRVVLEPMNPYERRVMHSALQNHPYVQTHSEGEEPYRRVIITLK